MLILVVILLVVFVVLSLLLAAWTLFFQGYIYSEPVEAIYWRAPAAAGALTLYLVIWIVVDYRSVHDRREEGRYHPLHEFSYSETQTFKYLWILRDGQEEQYTLQGNNQYVNRNGKRLPERPTKVLAANEATGEKQVFEPEMENGRFKTQKEQKLRYYDKANKSRYMDDTTMGTIYVAHYGWLVGALLLHLGFLLVWFAALWLLLHFQWPHALGLAFLFCLLSLFVLPLILTKAEAIRKERLTTRSADPSLTLQARCFLG